jgi:predicted Rossmann-fold nucleotide-binding protein
MKECIVFEGGKGTMDEIVKAMDMDSLPRGQDLLRALIPACEFLQISMKLGAKLLAQTAALFWSVEHMFYNFEVGI